MSAAEEIIVVGGGFAGATAARDLGNLGYRVRLLEARDRLGGRTHVRTFAETSFEIETGGAHFLGEHQRFSHREISRYGIEYTRNAPVEHFGYLVGGNRVERPFPLSWDDAVEFERFAMNVLRASSTIDPSVPVDLQPLKSFDLSWAEFLAPLELSPVVRDFIDARGLQSSGGRPDEDSSAISQLWQTALIGNSIVSWHTISDHKIEGGTRALLDAMIADSSAEVHSDAPVAAIEQDGTGVRVTTGEGQVLTAAGVVLAVPVNCWPDIAFSPGLSADKVRGAQLRPGTRAAKVFVLVEDAPQQFMGYGGLDAAEGVTVMVPHGHIDGVPLFYLYSPVGRAAGFPDNGFDPFDVDQVQRAVSAYVPGGRVVATDVEHWPAEPFSKGAYATYRIGQMEVLAGMRRPEGRVTFAGSDIARGFVGWIDGAIESGAYAAADLNRIVTESR